MSREFIDLLFRPGEMLCLAKNQYGTNVYKIAHYDFDMFCGYEFFSINPMVKSRANENCTSFRNILVEFDKMPLDNQRPFVESIGLPWSTCVFSGNKSFHFIISLKSDISQSEYAVLVRRVYRAVGEANVDANCKNPSRLSRHPGVRRESTGSIQELVAVASSIDNGDLEAWLLSRGVGQLAEPIKQKRLAMDKNSPQWFTDIFLNKWTRDFLENGAEEGDRHRQVVLAAYDFCRVGKGIDEARSRLLECSGLEHQGRAREVDKTVEYCYATFEKP